MGASSNRAAKSWPWNWKRKATNGSSQRKPRLESVPMLKTLTEFSRAAIEERSRLHNEPDWLLQLRLHAWEVYEQTPAPLGRRGDLGIVRAVANFKLHDLKLLADGTNRVTTD